MHLIDRSLDNDRPLFARYYISALLDGCPHGADIYTRRFPSPTGLLLLEALCLMSG